VKVQGIRNLVGDESSQVGGCGPINGTKHEGELNATGQINGGTPTCKSTYFFRAFTPELVKTVLAVSVASNVIVRVIQAGCAARTQRINNLQPG